MLPYRPKLLVAPFERISMESFLLQASLYLAAAVILDAIVEMVSTGARPA